MQFKLILFTLIRFIPSTNCFCNVKTPSYISKNIHRFQGNLHNTVRNNEVFSDKDNITTIFKHIPISHNQNDNIYDQHIRKFPSLRTIAYTNKTNNNNKLYNATYNADKLVIMVDIDGTICNISADGNYSNSKPILSNIAYFNKMYEVGHEIHYWTARGAVSKKRWDEYTYLQLQKWNVKYTTLNMGKPHYDIWIDDKAINPEHMSSKIEQLHL